MADHRIKARNTMNYLRIDPRCQRKLREERLLVVEVPKEAMVWPSNRIAQHCLRVALENGCTRIRIEKGVHGRAEFDVMDMVTFSRKLSASGTYLATPKMKKVPANLATMGFARLGNKLETKRLVVPVRWMPTLPVSAHQAAG